jgi:hypothetical protein
VLADPVQNFFLERYAEAYRLELESSPLRPRSMG